MTPYTWSACPRNSVWAIVRAALRGGNRATVIILIRRA